MATLEIKNIGPIREAKFDLNRINVFMGPQSSGKSTIAKIISYCTWVEKDVATSQSLKTYQENKTLFKDYIESFHKIKNYFVEDSFISYKSEVMEIKWENGQSEISWVDQYVYKRSKISYMPAERNIVILPEARKVEFGNTNVRSFLFDWFDARKKYSKENNLPILDLGVNYYYSESSDEDRIAGKKGGVEYDILLSNASSGLQSITPLVVMIDYLTNWIYSEDNMSFEQEERKRRVNKYLIDEKVIKPYFNILQFTQEERSEMIAQLNEKIRSSDDSVKLVHNNYVRQLASLFSTQNSQFIVEEPEQNLFPETQRSLIYNLLEQCLENEENRLTITTHSPYVLYALNNCMMGGLVNSQLKGHEERKVFLENKFLSKRSWINPKLVSVWEIEDGEIRNIQDKDNIISENYFDIKMTELTDEYYQLLSYYNDEE